MKKPISVLVVIIIFLSLCVGTSGAANNEGEYEITDAKYLNRPFYLQDALDEIKSMINKGESRWDIAKRAATIADGRIVNANMLSYEFHTYPSNWLWPLIESPEIKALNKWRSSGGADKQYGNQAKWVWDNKTGQCAENSCLVYYLLKEAGAKNVRIFGQGDPDHAFVVWGMDEEADPKDASAWTNDVIVPDGWQGKVMRGPDAFKNKYCGHDGLGVDDNTHFKDSSAKPRCGFRPDVNNMKRPCCTKEPYAPCRGDKSLACVNGECVYCGSINKYCCENEKCNFSNLECKDGKCIEKKEEVQEAYIPPECVGASGWRAKAECTFEVSKRNDLTECYKTTDPELRDYCFYWMARKRGERYICENIVDNKIAGWCREGKLLEEPVPESPGEP